MKQEIERKFLLKSTAFKKVSFTKKHIVQGFLNSNKNRVVRIRIIDEKAYLTIKGISEDGGLTRLEWEKEILLQEAKSLMTLSEKEVIEKYRYYHKIGEHIFEIDEFLGSNKGLFIAEVELQHRGETFLRPTYLGKEVTGQEKYYNSNLSKYPFKDWG